jgi:hypothetical protein
VAFINPLSSELTLTLDLTELLIASLLLAVLDDTEYNVAAYG